MAYQTDTPGFVNAVNLLLNNNAEADLLFRLTKPLALILPAAFYSLFNIPVIYGLFLQQLIAYWVSAFVLYKIIKYVTNRQELAYLGMLGYVLCQPVSVYGLAMLTDGIGWCWAILGIWFSFKIIDSPAQRLIYFSFLGLYIGIGLFIKESVAVIGVFIFYHILLNTNFSNVYKIKAYFNIGSTFIISFLLGNFFVFNMWGESLFQWIEFGHNSPPEFSLIGFIQQSYHTLDVYWFLVILGILVFFKTILEQKQINKGLMSMILTACSIWILLPVVWPYWSDRILFMAAPFIVVWIAIGADLFGKMAMPLVLFGGIMNVLVAFGIYKFNIGFIVSSALVFLFLMLVVYLFNYFKKQKSL
ncbi:MAG: hypothetical protein MK207_01210 [Saprospiraceae bacterium]|nr:hypothetical protein [Saprospiraceae bacterium]